MFGFAVFTSYEELWTFHDDRDDGFEFYDRRVNDHNNEIPIFGLQKHLGLEIEPRDFLKILTIWASFSYKLLSYKKPCIREFAKQNW